MQKDYIERILNNVSNQSVFYARARMALEILKGDPDYVIQGGQNGQKASEFVQFPKRYLEKYKPEYEPGGSEDAILAIESQNGFIYSPLIMTSKFTIHPAYNSKGEIVRLEITEVKPFDLLTGQDIEPEEPEIT